MATNGHRPAETRDRKKALIVGAVVAALLVFGLGYLLGTGGDEQAAASPATTAPARPRDELADRPTDKSSPTPSAVATPEPGGDTLPDGRYFVQLTDIQGGEEGPLLLQYDLAYFLTGRGGEPGGRRSRLGNAGAERLFHRRTTIRSCG